MTQNVESGECAPAFREIPASFCRRSSMMGIIFSSGSRRVIRFRVLEFSAVAYLVGQRVNPLDAALVWPLVEAAQMPAVRAGGIGIVGPRFRCVHDNSESLSHFVLRGFLAPSAHFLIFAVSAGENVSQPMSSPPSRSLHQYHGGYLLIFPDFLRDLNIAATWSRETRRSQSAL